MANLIVRLVLIVLANIFVASWLGLDTGAPDYASGCIWAVTFYFCCVFAIGFFIGIVVPLGGSPALGVLVGGVLSYLAMTQVLWPVFFRTNSDAASFQQGFWFSLVAFILITLASALFNRER